MKKTIYSMLLLTAAVLRSVAQTSTQNYVTTVSYLDSQGTDSIVSVQYFDGLGQLEQTVAGGSNARNAYLFSRTEYDGCGRESKVWAPLVDSNSPDYMSDVEIADGSISSYDGDAYAFSLIEYDALDRKTFVSTPGDAWQGRGKRMAYRYNKASEVRMYNLGDMLGNQFYAEGILSCTETEDEDGHKSLTFKDFIGNVILERKVNTRSNIDTYYVYDEIGQLRFVLQPMYQSEASLDKFAFQYTYDGHCRVASKKLPGCEPITYEYDGITDRVAKMQDGLLRAKGKFRTYEYDGLGRMTRQSISNGSTVEYDEIINYYDDYSFLTNNTMTCEGPVYYYLKKNSTGFHGQLTGTQQRASNGEELLTVYAYDDHGRIIRKGEIGLDGHLSVSESEYNFVGDIVKEDFTEYELDGNVYEFKHEGHITNNFDIPHTKLPTSSVIHLYEDNEATQMTDTIFKYTYDDFGHVIANNRSGTAGDMSYEYDNLHGWVKRIASSGGFEQKLYRETDGQKTCFNGSISAMTWKVASNGRLRRFDYEYDGMNRLRNAEYGYYGYMETSDNTSIFKLISNCGGEYENYSVQYWYDKNSNLTSIYRQGRLSFGDYDGYDTVEDDYIEYDGNQVVSYNPWACGDPYYSNFDFVNGADEDVEYFYDANGNLIRDLNKGLTFEYDLLGHPTKVSGSKNDIEYVYAPDGRKLRATHKTYTSTTKKTVKTSSTKDYTNGYIFTNGKPSMFSFDGGYYSFDGQGKLNGCHYYIQDYQGNNRMVVNAATNRTEQVTHYYPYGELMADISTSPDAQQFKYGGKELDRSFGLDLYDFHARQQDAKLGRFNSIDPLAEKYYRLSPYSYCAGDPVNCVDPTGEKLEFAPGTSDAFKKQFAATVAYMNQKGTSGGLAKLQASPKTYYIGNKMTANGKYVGNNYNVTTKTINIDLNKGLVTTGGKLLSPATLLAHETGHAVHDDQGTRDTSGDKDFDTKEERNTITNEETTAAKKHGEIGEDEETSRNNHKAEAWIEHKEYTPEQWENECKEQNF